MKRWIHSSSEQKVRLSKKKLDRRGLTIDDIDDVTLSITDAGDSYIIKGDPYNIWNVLHRYDLQWSTVENSRIVDKDEYNVQQYLPRKSLPLIEEITMVPDFDNSKGRTVYYYTVYFKNGDRVSSVGIAGITREVKNYMAQQN